MSWSFWLGSVFISMNNCLITSLLLGRAGWASLMLCSAYARFDQPLFMAFVGLRKAYDSVPRDTLWRILRVYGVHTKLIELLMDLHTGTQAAVRRGGVMSEWLMCMAGCGRDVLLLPCCATSTWTLWFSRQWLRCRRGVG